MSSKTSVTCPECGRVCKNESGLKIHLFSHKRKAMEDSGEVVEKIKRVKNVEAALRKQNKTLKMLAMMAIQELISTEL